LPHVMRHRCAAANKAPKCIVQCCITCTAGSVLRYGTAT
jgi:hypothetical protein